MLTRVNPLYATLLLLLTACGEGVAGGEDTLFTALSSGVILAFVLWVFVRAARKRG